jgi:hypothetical protein
LNTVPSEMRCRPSTRMSPTTKLASAAGCGAAGAGPCSAGAGPCSAGTGPCAAGTGPCAAGAPAGGGTAGGWPCGAGCDRNGAPKGWMAIATRQISRVLIRTRRPHAISMGSGAPPQRRKLDVGHDVPLIQMSGNIVIESEAHQHDQQGDSDLLAEILRPLGERAALHGFHELINHLPTIQ